MSDLVSIRTILANIQPCPYCARRQDVLVRYAQLLDRVWADLWHTRRENTLLRAENDRLRNYAQRIVCRVAAEGKDVPRLDEAA